ncbi:2-oxoglutarate and iron-dependent oxygenase JMJD4-like isoform X2 [Pollicipes pollicipes]|uniref:2-oxoglutarate and iron-dependent oxygenase JMJD4-like isoform X2 n=1 Tax=Pollicipes pollicipes TaxID=41117 RepID=UPI0018857264|nr:2-oxoglutarate and iron-dependent oxygenase JMJD4-like isoform X2 [Pollicipes pollicipes]XP_037069347.1 2-oxoglutarate and iron-dependent oxygenase JMJD4-like isoform X2 [Pollicipes pollicipes]
MIHRFSLTVQLQRPWIAWALPQFRRQKRRSQGNQLSGYRLLSQSSARTRDEPEIFRGNLNVPVANCSEKYFDSQPKAELKLKEYLQYMKQKDRQDTLYLKDWHFHAAQRLQQPADPPVYRTPCLFASDWLNEFWEEQPELRDDFRFVYVGVAGTWTPFHADVFRSFSWSANVCGRKRWILLPPGEEEKLRSLSQLPFDVAGVLGAESPSAAVSSATLPAGVSVARLQPKTSPGGVRYFDVIQEAGEVMFVPSDWHHQVWNLRDTISINHNWLNAANVGHASRHLLASLTAVKAELADIADGSGAWLAQCQQLLKATHGMDVREFVELLCFAADRRLDGARGAAAVRGLDGWQHSRDHLRWDLARVRCVLRRLLALEDVTRAPDMDECLARAQRVIADIEEVCPPEAGGAPGPGQCDCGVCA